MIRQPYADLIRSAALTARLRGIKTAELRSMSTTIVGNASSSTRAKPRRTPVPIWSDDLRAGTPPAWMIELAEQVKLIEPECTVALCCRRG